VLFYELTLKSKAVPMQLNDIQIEILNDNLSKAHQLAELMYQASIEPTKKYILIHEWREQLKRLTTWLDDMRGAYHCR
jgi:hypothetical protein